VPRTIWVLGISIPACLAGALYKGYKGVCLRNEVVRSIFSHYLFFGLYNEMD
jgi:hypothetical protein